MTRPPSRLLVGLYLATAALLPWVWIPHFPWRGDQAQWSDALFAVTFALWLWERGRRIRRPEAWQAWAAAYVGWGAVSLLASGDLAGGWPRLAGMAMLAALALVTADLAACPGMVPALARVVAVNAFLIAAAAVWALLCFYRGIPTAFLAPYGDLPESARYARVAAGFWIPPMLASYGIFAAAVLDREDARLPLLVRRAALAAVWLATLATLSRGILGLLLARAVRHADRPSRRRAVLAGAVVLAVLVGALSAVRVELNPARPWELRVESYPEPRRAVWFRAALRTLSERPLFGCGPGSRPARIGVEHWDAHCTPLNLAAGLGIPALLAFAGLCLALWRTRPHPTDRATWGALAGLALDGAANDVEDFRHLWILFGLSRVGAVERTPPPSPSPRVPPRGHPGRHPVGEG